MTKHKILVIALGGTIGSVKKDSIDLDSNNLKILDCCIRENVEFTGVSPFSILSENMSIALWKRLIAFMDKAELDAYDGIILLHGSDTLAFTSAIIANAFPQNSIVLVAADKPIEDKSSNGIDNFNMAVDLILSGAKGVHVAYDKIMKASCITGADINDRFVCIEKTQPALNSRCLKNRNILIINVYPGIDFNHYNYRDADAVLISMYHSATVPDSAKDFSATLTALGIENYFVTHKSSADYETAKDIDNILYSTTIENAYARLLLAESF